MKTITPAQHVHYYLHPEYQGFDHAYTGLFLYSKTRAHKLRKLRGKRVRGVMKVDGRAIRCSTVKKVLYDEHLIQSGVVIEEDYLF